MENVGFSVCYSIGGGLFVVRRFGGVADGDVGNLCGKFHHYIYWLDTM